MTKKCKLVLVGILSLLLVVAVAFGSYGLMFARADEITDDNDVITLSDSGDFTSEGGVLSGLSEQGQGKIADADKYAVVLPDGLTKVGDNAFANDTKLCSVTIPGSKLEWSEYEQDWYGGGPSYEEIGAGAFSGCTGLESVIFLSGEKEKVEKIEQQLTTIGESAFANTALTSITIPAKQWTKLKIGKNAFDTATLKSITVEHSFEDFEWLCSENLTLKTLDISQGDFGVPVTEKPTPIKFEKGSTVYLPEAGDIYSYFLMETLYMVSNADTLVITDEFTSAMISGLTVESIRESIEDYKHGSTEKATFIEDLTDEELQEALDKINSNDQLEVTSVTFIATDAFGREFTMQQSKLVGKSFRWEFKDDEWVENENYQLPSEVQGVSVNPNRWTFIPVDDYYVNLDTHNVLKDQVLYQVIYAHIDAPTDTEIVYTGSEYQLEGELAQAATITKIVDAEGNTVDKALDAGTYTVTIALNNEDDDNSGDRGERVDKKKYIWSDGKWTMGDEDGKLEGAWVGIEYTDDNNSTRYKTQWATEYYAGGTIVDGKLVGATKYDFNALTYQGNSCYIGTWNETDQVLENPIQIVNLYGNGNWSKGSFGEISYTLVIGQKTVELEWRNNGVKIEDVNNYELDYSASITLDQFTAFIGDERIALSVGSGLVFTKGGEVYDKTTLEEGTYVVTASHKNYNFTNATFGIRINAQTFDLSGNINWTASGGTLIDGTVYVGGDSQNPTIHTLPHPGIVYTDIREVKQSIVRYTGQAITLSIIGEGYTSTLEGNVATESGIYTATATLTANAGFRFTTNLTNNFAESGITVTIGADGKTAVVTKTWYIIELENELLDNEKSDEANTWVVYSIDGWTFGDEVVVKAPRLVHGDEGNDWQSNDNVKFELRLNNVIIASEFTRSQFAYYINGSMPAGNYSLIATVSVVTLGGTHTHWWDGEAHTSTDTGLMAHNFTRTYEFTVANANIVLNSDKLVQGDNGYEDYTWEITASVNKELFFKTFADKVNAEGALTLTTVARSGYWDTQDAGGYFGAYELTYNLSRMNNETYLAASSNNLLNYIDADVPDTYTVYFQITAPNHSNLTDTHVDGRYAYYFTVTVFKTIEIPEVIDDGLVYTSNKVLPEIAESELYEVIWDSNDTYVAGGQHSVAFKLYDKVHYRWKGTTNDTVFVDFTIAKADNAWVRVPNIVNWSFETFDTQVNRIRAVVKFLDEGQSIKFAITKADGTAIAGLNSFTVKQDGTTDNQEVIAALNGLKVGDYKLVVTISGTGNYNELSQSIDFKVNKSINTWLDGDDDLVLPSWIVGQFSLEDNPIVVKATHGEVKIQIRDINGVVYYDSSKPEENTLNDLDVNKYLLVAWVDGSDDYEPLAERSFTIEVLKKIGLPWWGTTLVAVGALGLAAAIILILWKLKVFEILTDKISLAITTRATVDATIAAVRATKRAEEAEAHKRKVEARERLEAAREAYRNKTPEERAQALQEKAEATATRAEEMQARASKLQKRADKLAGNTEQPTEIEQPEEVTEEPSTEDENKE